MGMELVGMELVGMEPVGMEPVAPPGAVPLGQDDQGGTAPAKVTIPQAPGPPPEAM